ncbi:hypothetical protein BD560DRAFT_488113 [Blakeslea trispora]|nr:hypothetical protein BD560DRAFT_488113 [Blakeslea trispora]
MRSMDLFVASNEPMTCLGNKVLRKTLFYLLNVIDHYGYFGVNLKKKKKETPEPGEPNGYQKQESQADTCNLVYSAKPSSTNIIRILLVRPDTIRTQPGEPRTSYTVQSHHPNTRQARCHTGNQESLEPRIQCKAIIHKYHKNTSRQARYYTSNQERRKAYLLLEPWKS